MIVMVWSMDIECIAYHGSCKGHDGSNGNDSEVSGFPMSGYGQQKSVTW